MKGLTPHQQTIVDLRDDDPSMSYPEISKVVGSSPAHCLRSYNAAKVKLGERPKPPKTFHKPYNPHGSGRPGLMEKDPDTAAELILGLTLPKEDRGTIEELCEELGVNERVASALREKLEQRFIPLTQKLGEVQKTELRDLHRYNAWRILASISDVDIADATLKDKAIAAGIFTDKSQILDGEPDHIFSVKEMQNIDQIAASMLHEMKRRNLEPDTNPQTQETRVIDVPSTP